MIDREHIKFYESILNSSSSPIDLSKLDELLYYIIHNKEEEFLNTVLNLIDPNVNKDLLFKVLRLIKEKPELKDSLFDSFSVNQSASKNALLDAVNNVVNLDKESTVFIWGSWYGSILIPKLAPKVKKVVCIDLDNTPLQIAKNRLFNDYKNVEYICDDVFKSYKNLYLDTNLIINTSCEHMPPMKEWKWFGPGAIKEDIFKGLKGEGFGSPKLSSECYFVFQSNNMFGIEGHINCVNSINEFKDQLPERAKVLYEEEVEDTRGTRYMLIGKFMPL